MQYAGKKEEIFKLVKRVTEVSGFTNSIGVEVENVDSGKAVLSLLREDELTQFNGFFHGGVIAGLADHAAGAAATSMMPEGRIAVTVDLNINYLLPASGNKLVASAELVSSGGSICVVSVRLCCESQNQNTLCSIATVTLRSVEAPLIS